MDARLSCVEPPALAAVRQVVFQVLQGLPVRVVLFGSWARGEARPGSDVDVPVERRGPLPPGILAELRQRLEESSVPQRVDLVDLDDAPEALRAVVEREGVEWSR